MAKTAFSRAGVEPATSGIAQRTLPFILIATLVTRFVSKQKKRIKTTSGAALVIDAKLIGPGPTKQGNARQKRYAQAGNLYWIFG